MPYHLTENDQHILVFNDETKNQFLEMKITNKFNNRMKFGWETGFAPILEIIPATGCMEPFETRSFVINFHGAQLLSTDILDVQNLALKMWWMPAETRKRSMQESKIEVPVIFAIHVQPKLK
ncbi:unnamed protein product [Caenorhabditis angaria]|uniref:MSP domain-containing protein n=1 Tax=Caenorhabditis angaria TaxID=860376 RepID=A0A9P1I9T6_9PELO|nr:unnamed protein product [Caenorhabditis angaria]